MNRALGIALLVVGIVLMLPFDWVKVENRAHPAFARVLDQFG
jgi:hypothetical protein